MKDLLEISIAERNLKKTKSEEIKKILKSRIKILKLKMTKKNER